MGEIKPHGHWSKKRKLAVIGATLYALALLLMVTTPLIQDALKGDTGATGLQGRDGTTTIIYILDNRTLTITCTIAKSQLNSSQNQTLTCTVA